MELLIKRTYHPKGTNGVLYVNGQALCKTIELPWLDNKSRVSCIPEGTYPVVKRTSSKFGQHLYIINVPSRDLILFHPANNALKELNGCIAPVTTITGEGMGTQSKDAFNKLLNLTYSALNKGEKVTLTIT